MVRRSTVVSVVVVAALAGLGVWWVADDGADRARVTVETANGTAVLEMAVADTSWERHEGLSGTTDLPADGMVFRYSSVGERAYVMRGMNYPIDIVFVANGEVTAIHHAVVEDPPLTRYRGRARCVLELPYKWTAEHGVTVGNAVVCFGS
ncbi:DUF192 domain-containing protein [Salarchaeum sp. JOR-1]|uniref:DUF192 domain-containing protein n=1 Tax=Salarchaeum sp. JOR-1 TaxID=2599399 RepID=UPI001198C98E|nr:DUF192 domain-containing protein [Salarchaeum sp. JOR-1]QDX39981.1 DUF192 domain-containing protein [Salarchaeum sp. JOR-1]